MANDGNPDPLLIRDSIPEQNILTGLHTVRRNVGVARQQTLEMTPACDENMSADPFAWILHFRPPPPSREGSGDVAPRETKLEDAGMISYAPFICLQTARQTSYMAVLSAKS